MTKTFIGTRERIANFGLLTSHTYTHKDAPRSTPLHSSTLPPATTPHHSTAESCGEAESCERHGRLPTSTLGAGLGAIVDTRSAHW